MRGYSKIKEGSLFSQRSKSKKDFPFLDRDFDGRHDISSPNDRTTAAQSVPENEQKPKIDECKNNKNDLFLGEKAEECHDEEHHHQHVKNGEKKIGGILKRNFSVSSSYGYQKSSNTTVKGSNLERQSSTRAIQEVVKRAFSMRRSSSVNSERYCRIYDQSLHVQDFDNYDYVYDDSNHGNNNHQDDDGLERSGGSMEETRSISMNKKKTNNNNNNKDNSHGKSHVGSKVARACRRLFSR